MNASAVPLTKKLGISGDMVFTVVGAPAGFTALLGDVGDAVWQRHLMPPIDVVVSFFADRSRLAAAWPGLADAAAPAGAVWVAWPKMTSGAQTDLDEAALRAVVQSTGWVDNKMCSIDDTWSAMRFVVDTKPKRPRRR